MWSNISAPKSGLKAAQLGQHQLLQVKQENGGEHWSPPGKQQQQQGVANGSPLTRYKHAVCASSGSDGFIYIHGGRFGNGVSLDDDVWRFDPHANTWQQLQTSGCRPPSLQEHSLVEHRGQLYLFGGQVSAASGQENSFWRLDLIRGEWFSLNLKSSMKFGAYLGPANRRGHSACIYRDSMYIFGGYEDFRGSTNQLWQYDLLNERWELRNLSSSSACHPEARHSHSAIVYQDSMFIYGGLSNLKPLGDLWRWSWRDKRWFRERTRGKSPGPLHGHSAIQAFGSMFVFGGERQSGRTTRSLWRLNLSNLCWQKIKTKGPRPSPTTWHVAIANPMSALDEANYLIEGGDSSDLEQHQHQDERLALLVNRQSASDNCFSQSSSVASNGRDHLQQTIPMETTPLRPRVESNACQRAPVRSIPISHSIASIELMSKSTGGDCVKVNSNQRDRTKAKRRLKLSFLRRNKKTPATGATCGSEPQKIPTSWSAVDIQAGEGVQVCPVVAASKRHSIELPTDGATRIRANPAEVEMSTEVDAQSHNNTVAILDSLDSDIKDMFERAMSPCEHTDRDTSLREVLVINTNATTNGTSLARDSMTQSQLSSWLTGVAGPTTSTQTYQTARDQLTSQSTLTITPTQLNGAQVKQEESQAKVIATTTTTTTTSGRLADVRQRRSMQHFTSQQTRRGRPKSEIVQSLIDRADVIYADHHKTLNFKLDQPHAVQQAHAQPDGEPPLPPSSRFNSNDPLLGALANHRMFGQRQEAPSASKRPALDMSKRHTIHQTMTYYNLYFGQADHYHHHQAAAATAAARQLQRQPVSSDLTQSSSASGSSAATTCRDNAINATQLSTSAALIGVRDGSGGSQQTGTSSRLESMASSDSRTLCDVRNGRDLDLEVKTPGAQDSDVRPIDDHLYQRDNQQQQHSDPPTLNNDNTSLSFSMIAEFEEDDMLQYSSPTEPKMAPDKEDDADNDVDDDDDENEYDYYEEDNEEQLIESYHTNGQHRNEQSAIQAATGETATKQLIAQKSTSSGYDSIRSSCNDGAKQEESRELNHHNEYSTSCSLDQTANSSSPGHNHNNNSQLQLGAQAMTTADSLHTTATEASTSTGGTSPLSPPSKSLPSSPLEDRSAATSSHKSSFASSLIAGPSRLFGKKKTKTRYWQLCMFVLGGKQQSGAGHGNLNEPISIWRLYI